MLRGGRASKRGGIEGEFTAGSIRACLLQTKTGCAQNGATLPESGADAEQADHKERQNSHQGK